MTRTTLMFVGVLLFGSCIDEPCDSTQFLVHGVCLPAAIIRDAREVDARDGDAGPEVSVPFGASCRGDGECGGVTNLCAIIPGEEVGFCTHTGCLEEPSICPADMTCVDLTPFGRPGMSVCYGG